MTHRKFEKPHLNSHTKILSFIGAAIKVMNVKLIGTKNSRIVLKILDDFMVFFLI